MDTKGGMWGVGWWWCDELGDWDTLMCIKLMTNKDLLYKKINKIQKKQRRKDRDSIK